MSPLGIGPNETNLNLVKVRQQPIYESANGGLGVPPEHNKCPPFILLTHINKSIRKRTVNTQLTCMSGGAVGDKVGACCHGVREMTDRCSPIKMHRDMALGAPSHLTHLMFCWNWFISSDG